MIAESAYGTIHTVTVTRNNAGENIVKTVSGVLLGDKEDMQKRGWEFTE